MRLHEGDDAAEGAARAASRCSIASRCPPTSPTRARRAIERMVAIGGQQPLSARSRDHGGSGRVASAACTRMRHGDAAVRTRARAPPCSAHDHAVERRPRSSGDRTAALSAHSQDELRALVRAALDEDGAFNDLTTIATVVSDRRARATLVARATGVIAGVPLALEAFRQLDAKVTIRVDHEDGARVERRRRRCSSSPATRARCSSAERVALNFMQRLSGIATLTATYVDAVRGTQARRSSTRARRRRAGGAREVRRARRRRHEPPHGSLERAC